MEGFFQGDRTYRPIPLLTVRRPGGPVRETVLRRLFNPLTNRAQVQRGGRLAANTRMAQALVKRLG